MQRSRRSQSYLSIAGIVLLFLVYESLSSIYLFLPPLLGILFYYYMHSMRRQSFGMLLLVSLLLIIYEANNGYLIFSTLIYFAFLYRFVIPKLKQLVDCVNCLHLLHVVLAYLGYWLFMLLIHQVLWIELPAIDWYVLYYIVIEFLVITQL